MSTVGRRQKVVIELSDGGLGTVILVVSLGINSLLSRWT